MQRFVVALIAAAFALALSARAFSVADLTSRYFLAGLLLALWALALPAAGAARFTLASPDRSGEAAAALHVIERHPVAGVGPGRGILRWIGPGGGLRIDRFDHDGYLQVLTDLGIIGAVLAAAFLAAAGQLLWRARPDLPRRAAWAGAAAGTGIADGFIFACTSAKPRFCGSEEDIRTINIGK